MELSVFVAVILSALFQASWNFSTKRSRSNKIALLAVGWFSLGCLLLPVSLYFDQPSWQDLQTWAPYVLGTTIIHAFYLCLLGSAYASGEISMVYPISRGLGIVGTALFSFSTGLQPWSNFGAAGILLVALGTLSIGLKEIPKRESRHAFLMAIGVALSVSSYSIVDSFGAKVVPTLFYVMSMNILAPLWAAPFLYWKMRGEILRTWREHKLEGLAVALAGMFGYSIILWAFRHAPVAYVAALREVSVLVAVLLGVIFLRESLYKRKIIGVLLIVAGAICLKLL